MKKFLGLTLAGMMVVGNVGIFAQDTTLEPVITNELQNDGLVSTHQITYRTPISLAELMTIIVNSTGTQLYPLMDTHYAMPAMLKAQELGILNLEDYPMDMWLTPLTEEEFNGWLSRVRQKGIDMDAVYTALNQAMVDTITVNDKVINLGDSGIRHYKGTVMVPLRPIAEAMAFDITWDKDTYTATLSNGKIQSPIQVGYDNYFYSSEIAIGMTAPMQLGVAPQLIDGVLYVPYKYFDLFATNKISDGTIAYTIK